MGLFSGWHILLVLLVFVLLFGSGKISGLMGDVAKGIKAFKTGMSEDEESPAPAPAQRESKLVEHKVTPPAPSTRSTSGLKSASGRKSR
jgi:sec-independent protein translocase protein TatA